MSLKSYFVTEKIGRFKSQINPDLEVVNFMGELRLDMGGLTQSGYIMRDIWKAGLKALVPSRSSINSILLLGLGAGSSAKLLSGRYKKAHLTGVDIDPVVIKIGKKYFGLDKIKNLKIVNADAVDFINQIKPSDHYDLVLIDCFQGFKIPDCFSDVKFLNKIVSHSSVVLYNRLNWDQHEIDTHLLVDKLKNNFTVKLHKTTSNLIISLSPQI